MEMAGHLQRIADTSYFSRMGLPIPLTAGVCVASSLAEAMEVIEDGAFDWMPSSQEDVDPFHGPQATPVELLQPRRQLNRALMRALSAHAHDSLRVAPHDFHVVARNAAMYGYRHWILERHLGLPPHWQRVIDWYERGHWPVGHAPGQLLVV